MKLLKLPIFFLLFLVARMNAAGQIQRLEKPRITATQGLPQSFISGIVQDRTGFIWIASRDGLARYDGRRFKVFRHKPKDSGSLAANVIVTLCLDAQQRLWIQYETGDIDILDTGTESLFHFTKVPAFRAAFGKIKNVHAIIQVTNDVFWLLGDQGGIFVADLGKERLAYYSPARLGLKSNPITGIEAFKGNVLLTTDSALLTFGPDMKCIASIPFTFDNPHLYDPKRVWKDNSPFVRKNGDVVIFDRGRIIVYGKNSKKFTVLTLPSSGIYIQSSHIEDPGGTIWFGSNGYIFRLTSRNQLIAENISSQPKEVARNILLDRSGVLWLGTNGFNLRQFDLRLPRMKSYPYEANFFTDILLKQCHVPRKIFEKSPLNTGNPYLFRWVKDQEGKTWMSIAGADTVLTPNLCYIAKGNLVTDPWHYSDTVKGNHTRVSGLAVSRSGKLWGIDLHLRLIRFDTVTHTATIVYQVPIGSVKKIHEINGFLMEGEDKFWFTTSMGLSVFDLKTKKLQQFKDIISGSEFTLLMKSPQLPGKIWAGSKGDGIIEFDRIKHRYRLITMDDSLPNNTVYTMLANRNVLWCSSNRGIFSFDPQRHLINSYTVQDGLPQDEFNSFHYFELPDGRLAFGGTQGYTLFSPDSVNADTFRPEVALTSIRVNNKVADYGGANAVINRAVNSLDTLELTYKQNFIELEFAALEYNVPSKINYRYLMTGLNNQWVETANSDKAVYTNLPPGRYTFNVNATNTAGQWSPYVKHLVIIIKPPFWLTWWFMTLAAAAVVAIVYAFIRFRLRIIRMQEYQKHQFEIEVIALESQALRAQMNPHFIFNCLNSIKALIQSDANRKAVIYLTTFSKLIRNQLNNDQHEISLNDELDTCKLYLEMERLRFGNRFTYRLSIDDTVNLYDIHVPPLFLQPIVENAIWHGILPAEGEGRITISVTQDQKFVICSVEDNGLGIKESLARKALKNSLYHSKGMTLIENRLRVFNSKNNTFSSLTVTDQSDQHETQGTLVTVKFLIKNPEPGGL